jgi:hypothetical protein
MWTEIDEGYRLNISKTWGMKLTNIDEQKLGFLELNFNPKPKKTA